MTDELLTPKELAAKLKCSERTVYREQRDGRRPGADGAGEAAVFLAGCAEGAPRRAGGPGGDLESAGARLRTEGAMTGMDKLKARQQAARKLMQQYEAELVGLIQAEHAASTIRYSPVPELQAAFERGLAEGREIVRIERAGGGAPGSQEG